MINFHPGNIEIWREWMLRLGDESHAAGINTICNLAINALALENELRAANLAIEGMRGPLANAIVRPEGAKPSFAEVIDAARYQWLRWHGDEAVMNGELLPLEELDRFIDSRLPQEQEGK